MSPNARRLWFVLFIPVLAGQALSAEPVRTDVLESLRKHIAPLAHPLADRLPILVWQSPDLPTGLEDGRVEDVQQLYMDRGLSPLCNRVGGASTAMQYVPVLKYRQSRGFPVCILPQGWVQAPFASDRQERSRSAHQPPAVSSHEFPCPAVLRDGRKLERGAAQTREVLTLLKKQGIRVQLLVVDFESGAYLRNTHDREEAVREQAVMAGKCPRCVETFTKDALSTPDGFAKVVDESRAFATRNILCDPAREVYPGVHIGNFYAWPVNRLPRPEGRRPAYGYEQSGMNVAMPRVYMNAGWRGAGRDQDKMNWNAFYCCLEGFSPAASVLREGELLIPWVHVWLGGRYLKFVMAGRRLPEPEAMREMACHIMLRGAETFAIWMDNFREFPAEYPYPEYAAMGQFVYDVKGVQEGFQEMLEYNSFLRRAKPMTFEVPGQPSELGPQTATWSGMATTEKALVRTVVFDSGRSVTKTVKVFGKSVRLTFGPKGRNHWVFPDGKVRPAAGNRQKSLGSTRSQGFDIEGTN